LGYQVYPALLNAADFGIPQRRVRFFVIGIDTRVWPDALAEPFKLVPNVQEAFLEELGMSIGDQVSVEAAISDLRVDGASLVECLDSPGFKQIVYNGPKTEYQRQMHGSMNGHAPNSLRLAKHRSETTNRFARLVKYARKGVTLSQVERRQYGVKKQPQVVLDANTPSHTLTTLPDDYVHYCEPRILTVREYARIQSFPDWYSFQGVYTTGGNRRRTTCPRYSQIGNAVPPRMATFLGKLLHEVQKSLESHCK
jgi:DNA (cytosine-5)-methyltransferase 1